MLTCGVQAAAAFAHFVVRTDTNFALGRYTTYFGYCL